MIPLNLFIVEGYFGVNSRDRIWGSSQHERNTWKREELDSEKRKEMINTSNYYSFMNNYNKKI